MIPITPKNMTNINDLLKNFVKENKASDSEYDGLDKVDSFDILV